MDRRSLIKNAGIAGVLAAGVAWWFENGSASHSEGGHAADVDSNELTKLEK